MSEELNFRVRCYLASWDRNLPLEGGLAYAEELRGYQLDYSVDSLKRIDAFLDALHARLVPAGTSFDHSTFFVGQPNVNLLYFLAFYVGEVAARATGTPARWSTFADSVTRMPATAAFGEGFHSSVLLEEPGQFLPLVSIMSRLAEGPQDKSVHFSAGIIMPQGGTDHPDHLPLPPLPPLSFGDSIEAARLTLNLLPHTRLKTPHMPDWALDDPLKATFDHATLLYQEGRVVWGAVIQANTSLFTPYAVCAPGEVLYDPRGYAPQAVLLQVARRLFALRQATNVTHPALQQYRDHLNAETTRLFNWQVPSDLLPYPLTASTTYFDCDHLPGGAIGFPVFPLLVHDDHPGAVLPLPKQLWPEALEMVWQRKLRGNDDSDMLPEPKGSRPLRKKTGMGLSLVDKPMPAAAYLHVPDDLSQGISIAARVPPADATAAQQAVTASAPSFTLGALEGVEIVAVDAPREPAAGAVPALAPMPASAVAREPSPAQAPAQSANPRTAQAPATQTAAEAHEDILAAAIGGDITAMRRLGLAFLKGTEAAPKNWAKAENWLQRAATAGDMEAQRALGMLYLHDEFTGHDPHRAKTWLDLAARSGDAEAAKYLKEFAHTWTSQGKLGGSVGATLKEFVRLRGVLRR
jgi:hypothetical protein